MGHGGRAEAAGRLIVAKPGVTVIVLQNRIPSMSGVVKQRVRMAIAETLAEVETDAKLRAPVDTGNMRASITGQFTGETEGTVATGPQAPYAIYVHDGTRKVSPRPFLRQAAEAARPSWVARIRAALRGFV